MHDLERYGAYAALAALHAAYAPHAGVVPGP
jgi:hypothetical protein